MQFNITDREENYKILQGLAFDFFFLVLAVVLIQAMSYVKRLDIKELAPQIASCIMLLLIVSLILK